MTSTAAVTTAVHFLAALTLALALSRPDRYGDGPPQPDPERQKRAYTTWTEFGKWKAPLVQISRPYYIPIYGAPGKVPIYFPPQRLNLNPGVPLDNPAPKRPFQGPQYLPPTEEPTTTMTLVNRFNDDDDNDRPIWNSDTNSGGVVPPSSGGVVPTRAPRPSGTSNFPPLVHDINTAENSPAFVAEEVAVPAPLERSTTARSITSGPSNCAWAIITCCSVSTNNVPDKCFEQRGCPGPFWGSSPCESDFAKAAIASALNFYGNNNQ